LQNINKNVLPGAGPFYFDGNEIGIMMLPGFGGGTCADLKPLAEDLNKEKGYTIHIPLLPGFGTSPEDLRNTPITLWKEALEKEYSMLKDKSKKIIIGGHSGGGILTLILASKYKLDGIFTISAPVGIKRFIAKLVPFLKIFIKYYPIESEQFRKDTNGKWVGYDKIPLNIASKAKKLMKEMKDCLYKISCPALLFQGRLDSQIQKNSMEHIFDNISSKKKKIIWLENSDHPILDIPDYSQILSELIKFIEEICN